VALFGLLFYKMRSNFMSGMPMSSGGLAARRGKKNLDDGFLGGGGGRR